MIPIGTPRVPPFAPIRLSRSADAKETGWRTVLSCQCHFGLSTFLATLKDLTLHPERNSTLILRADPLPLKGSSHWQDRATTTQDEVFSPADPEAFGDSAELELVEEVRVRLMPKMPARDKKLDQQTLFYRTRVSEGPSEQQNDGTKEEGLVVMIPEMHSAEDIPYFHPPVRKIAFRWQAILADNEASNDGGELPIRGTITIGYLPTRRVTPSLALPMTGFSNLSVRPGISPRKRSPLAGSVSAEDKRIRTPSRIHIPSSVLSLENHEKEDQRLHRTCLALLERLYKHGYGAVAGYRQRGEHSRKSMHELSEENS